MRTTLYSRLKPNYKSILEEKAKIYPATYKGVLYSLQKTMYSHLTIGELTDLTIFIGLYDRTEVGWYSGKDLFNLEQQVA
jgi:DNA-binding ferritin-like protein (Dps family)